MNLTDKETKMLVAFINEGRDSMGAQSAQELKQDNMTWMNADDLQGILGGNKQEIGGVMASLLEKGLIADSGESARGSKINDFTATDEGIDLGFPLATA